MSNVSLSASLEIHYEANYSRVWFKIIIPMISSLTFILQQNINSQYNHLAIPDEEPGHVTAEFKLLYKLFNTLWSNPKNELFLDVYIIFIVHAITTDNSGRCP